MSTLVRNARICPIVIGRAPYIELLDRLVGAAAQGRGSIATLAGEAGIGKSRLVEEARAIAEHQGMRVLVGHCFEFDRSLPFAPWLDLFRMHLATLTPDEIQRELGPTAVELVRLIPELSARLPALIAAPPLDPEQEKRRLFESLTSFLIQITAAQPLLVVIEDLHWSDETSLEFIAYLARRSKSRPILILLTYRTDEAYPALTHLLATLDRERLLTEISLPRLSPDQVAAMVRAIFHPEHPIRAPFLTTLYTLTEGNPFFIEEVLQALPGDAAWDAQPLDQLHIPRSIHDAVQTRSARVSPAARQVLTLAAVAGRRFDFALLQQLTASTEAELTEWIKELIAAQLVVEASAQVFAFRHALTREVVYGDLLARERQTLHRRIAQTIEDQSAGSLEQHAPELAYHYYSAGAWDKALEYSMQVGKSAFTFYAPRAAIEHFTHALESARQLGLVPPSDLHRTRGRAYEILGEFESARTDYEASLHLAQERSDPGLEWQSLIDLGSLWASRDYAQAGTYFRAALELARTAGDHTASGTRLLARSLNRMGNWYLNAEQPLEAQQHHREAQALFEQAHDVRGLAETLDLLGMAACLGGDLVQSRTFYEQALGLLRDGDDRQGLSSSLATLTLTGATYQTNTMVAAAPTLGVAVHESEMALEIARQIDWRAGEAYALITLALGCGPQGEYARALDAARQALVVAEEIEHRQWTTFALCALGEIHTDLLAWTEARTYLERALTLAQGIASWHWRGVAAGFLASTYIAQGEWRTAAVILDAVLAPNTPAQTLGQRLAWCARAELALARRQVPDALRIIEQQRALTANAEHRPALRLSLLSGKALAALGQTAQAEVVLAAGAQEAERHGARSMLWRLQVELGRLYQSQSRRDQAERAYSTAEALVAELAATVPDESLRDQFTQSALVSLPRRRPISSRRQTAREFAGLTERERQVAALVARGLSNRALAAALVVSERTIETHVANIMAKLGFDSRAQIASWATAKGLDQHTK